MRMTKALREQIVRDIMKDTPKENYQEQAEDLLRKIAHEVMPPEVTAAAKAHPFRFLVEYPEVWVGNKYGASGHMIHIAVRGYSQTYDGKKLNLHPDMEQVCELARKEKAQRDTRKSLKDRLEGMFMGVTTRKQFVERFPQFAKYMPMPDAPEIKTLPVDPAIFETLKELGWKE